MEEILLLIFLIGVPVLVLWVIFRQRQADSRSKRKERHSAPQPMLRDRTNIEELRMPIKKPSIPKQETWIVGPDDVLKEGHVSFTKMRAFKQCPRMFELIYLYGFEDRSGKAAQVGSLVHEIVRLYTVRHKGNLANQLRLSGAVEELLSFYDQAKSSMDLTYDIPKSELRSYLGHFVVLNGTEKSQIQATEYECNSTIGFYNLKCIIDRIDIGSQANLTIIDYKTGNPQNVVDHQLNVYAYALGNGKWTPFQLVFQFLKNGEIRDWEYTPQLHLATEQWLLEGIEEISCTKVFRRTTSRLCSYCGVRQHCYRAP